MKVGLIHIYKFDFKISGQLIKMIENKCKHVIYYTTNVFLELLVFIIIFYIIFRWPHSFVWKTAAQTAKLSYFASS